MEMRFRKLVLSQEGRELLAKEVQAVVAEQTSRDQRCYQKDYSEYCTHGAVVNLLDKFDESGAPVLSCGTQCAVWACVTAKFVVYHGRSLYA